MSINPIQESARIYQFPAGGRAALGGKRWDEFSSSSLTSPGFECIHDVDCSSSWYHEAAIREAAERGCGHEAD